MALVRLQTTWQVTLLADEAFHPGIVNGQETYEENVESPAHVFHGDGGYLADHGVEGEGDHDADADAFGTRSCVEDFCGHDPYDSVSLPEQYTVERGWGSFGLQDSGPLVQLKQKL